MSSSIDHLGITSERVNYFIDRVMTIVLGDDDLRSMANLPTENAGRVGLGTVTLSLASI